MDKARLNQIIKEEMDKAMDEGGYHRYGWRKGAPRGYYGGPVPERPKSPGRYEEMTHGEEEVHDMPPSLPAKDTGPAWGASSRNKFNDAMRNSFYYHSRGEFGKTVSGNIVDESGAVYGTYEVTRQTWIGSGSERGTTATVDIEGNTGTASAEQYFDAIEKAVDEAQHDKESERIPGGEQHVKAMEDEPLFESRWAQMAGILKD